MRTKGQWQVSTGGGNYPHWRRDGREIFYLAPDSTLMAAEVLNWLAALKK